MAKKWLSKVSLLWWIVGAKWFSESTHCNGRITTHRTVRCTTILATSLLSKNCSNNCSNWPDLFVFCGQFHQKSQPIACNCWYTNFVLCCRICRKLYTDNKVSIEFVKNFHMVFNTENDTVVILIIKIARKINSNFCSAVDIADLGKATGLASATQWCAHFLVPIYTSHLVQSWHYTYAFYTSALLSIITLLYVIFITKHSNARVRSLLPSINLAWRILLFLFMHR